MMIFADSCKVTFSDKENFIKFCFINNIRTALQPLYFLFHIFDMKRPLYNKDKDTLNIYTCITLKNVYVTISNNYMTRFIIIIKCRFLANFRIVLTNRSKHRPGQSSYLPAFSRNPLFLLYLFDRTRFQSRLA